MEEPPGNRLRDSAHRKRATDQMEQARATVIGLLRQGKSPSEAMVEVGRSPKTYFTWTYASTKFAQQAVAAQEAAIRMKAQAEMPWRAQMDEFSPIIRADYKSWTEYQVAFRKAYFNFDTFDHQWQILEAWEKAPAGGISMMLVPPEAGKTTLLLDTIIGDMCDDPNIRRALISEAQPFARKMMGRIQRRLISDGPPTPLIEHFGPFEPLTSSGKRWNADEFTILASTHDQQDPSCIAVGIKGTIRGARWDTVDLDDIQSLRNINDTKKLVDIIRGDVTTRPGKHGRLRITGSRVGRDDVYGELERLDIIDEIVCIPALDMSRPKGSRSYFPVQWRKDENGVEVPITDANGNQMGWSDDDLAQREKKVGADQWSRVYMQRPQSEFSSMITEGDILNATDKDRLVGQRPPRSVSSIAGLDPSLAAHAAFTFCGYDADHLYVMDLTDLYKPATNQNLFAEILRGTTRYRPEWWVIENNTLQRGYLTDDAFLEIKKQFGFNAVGHHTGENKVDAQLGVPAMMAAIVRGEIRFPTIATESTAFVTLFDQLMAWRPDIPTRRLVQDQVMSLWFCYLLWRKLREQVDVPVNAWKRAGLNTVTKYPYARTNLAGLDTATTRAAARTYEQAWDEIKAGFNG